GDAGVQRRAEGERGGAEERAGDGLDDRITPRDRHAARAAAPAQRREGDERDVVVPGDRAPATRTRRARPPEAAALGHARDDDVQEASDQQAGDDERDDDHGLSGALPKMLPAAGRPAAGSAASDEQSPQGQTAPPLLLAAVESP